MYEKYCQINYALCDAEMILIEIYVSKENICDDSSS